VSTLAEAKAKKLPPTSWEYWRRKAKWKIKSIGNSPAVPRLIGTLVARYFHFVHWSSRTVFPAGTMTEAVGGRYPIILTCWHGQHFLLPVGRPEEVEIKALVSRHRDGEINSVALDRMGIGLIRGSGGRDKVDRGGARGLLELVRTLRRGATVFMIADINKNTVREAGLGIVTLGKLSGRPIVPAAYATRRRITLNSWDKATIHLPFSRGAYVFGEPIFVPRDADDGVMEAKRREVEKAINAVTERAYAVVDKGGA
jgi:lysophospholipid acyltransferase (LPLAT)-like uncharacterized protein